MTFSIKELTVARTFAMEARSIISDLNFLAPSRSITLLKGANGSGKSTLLDTISGLIRPVKGSIALDDIYLHQLSLKSAAIYRSYLQQKREFTLGYQVEEIMQLATRHCIKSSRTRSLKSLGRELDIEHLFNRSLLELSGGERERVSLALTLVREVPLYLFDEPLSAQDLAHCDLIATYLEKIARSGAILVIATHESSALDRVADQEITLENP
jgi:ABC-type cobalamin/Fe3+-siderophores transport system ATPase subunit